MAVLRSMRTCAMGPFRGSRAAASLRRRRAGLDRLRVTTGGRRRAVKDGLRRMQAALAQARRRTTSAHCATSTSTLGASDRCVLVALMTGVRARTFQSSDRRLEHDCDSLAVIHAPRCASGWQNRRRRRHAWPGPGCLSKKRCDGSCRRPCVTRGVLEVRLDAWWRVCAVALSDHLRAADSAVSRAPDPSGLMSHS
jgi:hypothetical protein